MTEPAIKDVQNLPAFVYASFGQRFLAYLIDIILISAIRSVILSSYELVGLSNSGANFGLFSLTGALIYFSYFILLTKYNQGQTIGKMILGLRVLLLSGAPLTWSDVLYRELISRYIQKKIKLLYFLLFFTKRKQTMADLISDTVVISEKSYLDLKDYLAYKWFFERKGEIKWNKWKKRNT